MPRIETLGPLGLYLHYREDGEEPHLHVRYQGSETRFLIATGQVMDAKSNLGHAHVRRVRARIEDNREELLAIWQKLRCSQRERESSSEKP
ncbi:MAG: DUF4160 domain-containing protein [Holophagales bacterium]|nr:DUF4160 domain-containing protein [Holophagales bacterium]MYD23303.1 DUF4160 domain-containing protein [Holophagales bacterium]MYI32913.1 DUF4160 domain-containing protein [Holophagales bacterium]